MPAILDIITALDVQLRADDPQTPAYAVGATALTVDRRCPVVIYVPHGERITGPEGQGGDGIGKPRPLKTRNLTLAVHLWDCDITAVEARIEAFVRAIHTIGWGAYMTPNGVWETGAEIVTGWGVVYTLTLELKIPITRVPDTYVTVTSIPITPAVLPILTP